ncbi:MAG: DUF2520 domain-containing protein [Spirochaetaceae bacterium]|jgi:hypothetical protein|nr:DUF2520 domain-containing protein [Spirochaetaceae bacterium]
MKNTVPCAIIGDGRMATHFVRYLKLSEIPYNQWSRKCNSQEDPVEYLQGSRAVFLLIKDDAIAGFVKDHPGLEHMNPLHFSGSLYLKDVPSIHPLMTFSNNMYSLEKYQSIPFIFEKGKVSLSDILPELPNPSRALDFDKKSLYHSLSVMSGNFTTMLWQKAFRDFENKLELDSDLLFPYMEQTFENLKTDWENALTGPLARKDEETIQRNMRALENDPYLEVYRSFADTVLIKEPL